MAAPFRVRCRWQRLGPDLARWEQSFSARRSGELNRTVEQRRERAAAGAQ